jgi:hypothetical protein
VVSPPQLDPVTAHAIAIDGDDEAGIVTLGVRGTWDRTLWQATSNALRDCFAAHPDGLIVDLTGLRDDLAESAPTWVSAQRFAGRMDPPVRLALCVPVDLILADRLQRLSARRFLPVYATTRQARVATESGMPPTEKLFMRLTPEPDAPSLARDMVGDGCRSWDLPHLLHPGRLVLSELVTNAVEHATETVTVVVSPRGSALHLAVSDDNPAFPRLLDLTPPRRGLPLNERGRGLRAVAATASAWGTLRIPAGKLVWALLRNPS